MDVSTGTGDLVSQINELEEDCSKWTYRGNIYEVPLFGPCASDELLSLGEKIDSGTLAGNPRELAEFIFSFVKAILTQKNDITDDHIKKIANIKTMEALFEIWMGKGH